MHSGAFWECHRYVCVCFYQVYENLTSHMLLKSLWFWSPISLTKFQQNNMYTDEIPQFHEIRTKWSKSRLHETKSPSLWTSFRCSNKKSTTLFLTTNQRGWTGIFWPVVSGDQSKIMTAWGGQDFFSLHMTKSIPKRPRKLVYWEYPPVLCTFT